MDNNKKSCINILDGKEAIKLMTEIGEKYNAQIGIEFGTLLGYVRDGGFIHHDDDIDVGMEYKYWNDNILSDLERFGFIINLEARFTEEAVLKFVGNNKRGVLNKLRLEYKGINICFNIWHEGVNEYKDYMYFRSPLKENYLIEIPKSLMVSKIKAKFYDIDIWIPENYMGFIEYAYGKTWQKPIVNYINGKEHKENRKRFRRVF